MSLISINKKQTFVLQSVVSVLALYLCFYDIKAKNLSDIFSLISFPLLFLAIILKTLGLIIREIRLWLILDPPKPPFSATIFVGLAAGLMHTFLPMRGGDILSVAMLNRYCNVETSRASVAVAISAFFEMFVFGCFLLGLLVIQPYWYSLLGEVIFTQSLLSTTVLLSCSSLFVLVVAFMGRKEESTESSPSPIKKFLSQVFSHTHKAITQKKIILQVSISTLEIFLMLLSFVLALWALQIPIEAPWGSVSLILAFSAIAAVALPPSYGAGPGAAIAFMFAILGLSTELAFAYTGLWWILSQVPTIMTGIPSFWLVKSKENMNR